MDAAKHSFSRTVFLVSSALLLSAGAYAQTPAFNLNATGTNSYSTSIAGTQPTSVSVASSTSPTTEITYTATTSYAGDSTNPAGVPWLCLNGQFGGTCGTVANAVTPSSLSISTIGSQAGSPLLTNATHTAVITLTPSVNTITPATITVTYTPATNSGGNGSAITATPSSLTSSVSFGGTGSQQFQLSTSSTTPITFNLVPQQNWIAVSQQTGTISSGNSLFVTAYFYGNLVGAGQQNGNILVTYGGNSFNIPVTFGNGVAVNGGGGNSNSLTLTPNPLSLSYSTGSGVLPSATVQMNGTAGVTYNAFAASSGNWLGIGSFQQQSISGIQANTQLLISTNSNVAALTAGTTYSGTITFQGTDGSTTTLTVNLTVNGTNNTGITIQPNPISISAQLNGGAQTTTVTVTSANAGTMNVSVSGSGLSISPTSVNIGAGGSTGFTITADPTGLSAQTYSGQLNVSVGGNTLTAPINFSVGGSSGGGNNSGSIFAAPSGLNFVYQPGVNMQANQQQQIYLAGSGNYTSSVTSGANFLSTSCTGGSLPSALCFVYANAASLASGTYTGAITFTNTSSSQTSVVSVTLLVTGSTAIYTVPGDLVFTYTGGSSSTSQFQDFTLLATNGSAVPIASVAVTNPSSTPWLSVSQNTSTTTTGVTTVYAVTVNAANLANGTYTGSITATAATGTASNSPLIIPVALNVSGSSVSGGGGNGALTLGSSSLTFSIPVNSSQSQQLSVSASTATNFTASASTSNGNSTWLSISPSGTLTTNTNLTVTANASGLSSGTYNGTITLVTSSGTQTVGVTMVVGGSGASGTLSVGVNGNPATSSPSLTFTANAVGASVPSQYLTVTSASGSAGVGFTASLSGASCGWVNLGIVANQTYLTPLNPLNVGANTGTLASGTYNCTLTLTPNGGTAVTVPLTLAVNGQPTITVPSTPLTFSFSAGNAAPNSQTIQITGAGTAAASFTAAATTSSGGNWLTVSPTSGTASAATPGVVTVSVDPTGLSAGTYNGTVSINAGSGSTGSGTVNVTLTVTAPNPTIVSVVNGASFLGGALSPGEFVTIFGTSIGPATPLNGVIGNNGSFATTVGQVQVFFNSTPAPLTYISSGQINCTVPYEVNGLSTVSITVKYLGVTSTAVSASVTSSAPGIFTATGMGTGQGAILNQNNTPNTLGNAAAKGSVIQVFMTGEGITSPAGTTGGITPYPPPTVPQLPIAVKIGGQPASVVFEGEAPGLIAGILQLNIMIPPTVSSGANSIQVVIGNNSSQSGVTVAVQ